MGKDREESKILAEAGHRDGMTVPPGYFADFASRMEAMIPEEQPSKTTGAPRRTFWQQVRPYFYMAAMFAGIWCMMKMFSLMGDGSRSATANPVLAEALGDEAFISDYCLTDVDEGELMDNLYYAGYQPDESDYSTDYTEI